MILPQHCGRDGIPRVFSEAVGKSLGQAERNDITRPAFWACT